MTDNKLNRWWLIATGVLILIIIVCNTVFWVRRDSGLELSISTPLKPTFDSQIYVDGAVANPGVYPLKSTDNIDSIIQAAGGLSRTALADQIQLHVPDSTASAAAQKININYAADWLLQALPGIGEVRAKAIIEYRQQNGLFRNITELTQVPGITSALFEKIRPYITVGE